MISATLRYKNLQPTDDSGVQSSREENVLDGMKNKTFRNAVLTAALAVAPMGLFASPSSRASMEDKVRHELVMLPNLSVFDNLSYSVEQTENGSVVMLSGQVTRPIRRSNAESVVKRIPGVVAVQNNIEVLPLSPNDDRIRLATLRRLISSAPLNKYFWGTQPAIRIIVKNGNITLDGNVINEGDRTIAFMAVNSIPGVFQVTNNLQTNRSQ